MVALVADPKAHDGQRVQVTGYLSGQHFEDCGLYLSKPDYDQGLQESAVQVYWRGCLDRKAASKFHGRYVDVIGVFEAGRGEYNSLFAGRIREVEQIRIHESRAAFAERTSRKWPWWVDSAPKWVLAFLFVAAVTIGAYRVSLRRG